MRFHGRLCNANVLKEKWKYLKIKLDHNREFESIKDLT